MAIRLGEAVKNAFIFISLTVIIVFVVSFLIASATDKMEFLETLGFCLIFGGVIVMYAGAMTSAGGAEKGALTSAMMTGGHHSNFYERYGQERQSRRDSQFFYMFLMVISGCILIGSGFWVLG